MLYWQNSALDWGCCLRQSNPGLRSDRGCGCFSRALASKLDPFQLFLKEMGWPSGSTGTGSLWKVKGPLNAPRCCRLQVLGQNFVRFPFWHSGLSSRFGSCSERWVLKQMVLYGPALKVGSKGSSCWCVTDLIQRHQARSGAGSRPLASKTESWSYCCSFVSK